jgi:mono/diheme cytochrome c family protein
MGNGSAAMATDNGETERVLGLLRAVSFPAKKLRVPALGVLIAVIWLGPINQGKAAETGQEIFQENCAACHTIGKGKLVGPDLAGVTSRREGNWLKRQIKEPEKLIDEKDPIALQLLKEAGDVPMATLELSDADVAAVISYLKSTEQQADVEVGLPSQYVPTILISILVLIGLTLIGLKVGSKNVDVR